MTNKYRFANIYKLSHTSDENTLPDRRKKLLTNDWQFDRIIKLSQRTESLLKGK